MEEEKKIFTDNSIHFESTANVMCNEFKSNCFEADLLASMCHLISQSGLQWVCMCVCLFNHNVSYLSNCTERCALVVLIVTQLPHSLPTNKTAREKCLANRLQCLTHTHAVSYAHTNYFYTVGVSFIYWIFFSCSLPSAAVVKSYFSSFFLAVVVVVARIVAMQRRNGRGAFAIVWAQNRRIEEKWRAREKSAEHRKWKQCAMKHKSDRPTLSCKSQIRDLKATIALWSVYLSAQLFFFRLFVLSRSFFSLPLSLSSLRLASLPLHITRDQLTD